MKQRIKFPKQKERILFENIQILEKQNVLLGTYCQALEESKKYYIKKCVELADKITKATERPIRFLNPYNMRIHPFVATQPFPIEKYENNIELCKKQLIEYMMANLESFVEFNFELDNCNPHIIIGKSKIYLGVKELEK